MCFWVFQRCVTPGPRTGVFTFDTGDILLDKSWIPLEDFAVADSTGPKPQAPTGRFTVGYRRTHRRSTNPVGSFTMTGLALFDLDDTLVDRTAAYRRWVAGFASGTELSTADLSVLYDVDLWEVDLPHQLRRIHGYFDIDEDFETFWNRFKDGYPRYVRCESTTVQGLTRIRERGWKVVIVTNGPTENQADKIMLSGLDRYVDGWVISEAEGAEKPALDIFEAAARTVDRPLSVGGWMVGDSQSADITGGAAAGLSTIWLSHGRALDPELTAPNHVVTSVGEAIDIIDPPTA